MSTKAPAPPPAARRLNPRECGAIIGATLAGLLDLADLGTIKGALAWWNESGRLAELYEKSRRLAATDKERKA